MKAWRAGSRYWSYSGTGTFKGWPVCLCQHAKHLPFSSGATGKLQWQLMYAIRQPKTGHTLLMATCCCGKLKCKDLRWRRSVLTHILDTLLGWEKNATYRGLLMWAPAWLFTSHSQEPSWFLTQKPVPCSQWKDYHLKRCKIVLCGQGGSVFSLSEFQYQQVPNFSWTVLYLSRLLLPDLIRNTKHRGRIVQPREINQRNFLSSHFCSLKTSHFSILARPERNTAFLKRKKTTNVVMLALTKTYVM